MKKLVGLENQEEINTPPTTNNKQVQVIGFITLDTEPTDKPLPDDYLSESGLPKEMIDLMKDNGWESEDGMIDFPIDFQPPPIKDENGEVWLSLNSNTMDNYGTFNSLIEQGQEMLENN